MSEKNSPESVEVVSWRVDETRKFKWKMENFGIIFKSEKLLSEQRFEFDAGHSIGRPLSWQCFLKCGNNGQVGIYIQPLMGLKDVEKCIASFTFTIYRTERFKFFCRGVDFKNVMADVQKGGWGFPAMIESNTMVEDLPLVNKSLIIEIEFTVHADKPVCDKVKLDVVTKQKIFESWSLVTLSKDLEQIDTLAGEMADGSTTVSMEEEEFPINREILAARSNVFRLMFQNKMKEAQTGKVDLKDLPSKTVKVLLHYVYTGRLVEDWKSEDVIEKLTIAAHRYEFKILTEFLDEVLGSVCTIGNAKRLALVVQRLGMKRAQEDLFRFIKNTATSLEDLILMDDSS